MTGNLPSFSILSAEDSVTQKQWITGLLESDGSGAWSDMSNWCNMPMVNHIFIFLTFRVKKYILYLGHQHIQTYWIVPVFALYASVLQGGGGSQKMIYSFILSNSLYMTQLLKHPRRISQAHLHSAMVTSFPVIPLFVPSIFRSWKTSCGASPQRRSPHSCHCTPYTC